MLAHWEGMNFLDLSDNPITFMSPGLLNPQCSIEALVADTSEVCCMCRTEHCRAVRSSKSHCAGIIGGLLGRVVWTSMSLVFLIHSGLIITCIGFKSERYTSHLVILSTSLGHFLTGIYMCLILSYDMFNFQSKYSVLLIDIWKSGFVCQIAKFLSSFSFLLFHFNLFAKAFDIYLMIKFPLSYGHNTKKFTSLTLLITWHLAMILGIMTVADPDFVAGNTLCSFHSLSFQSNKNKAFFTIVYLVIPLAVHLVAVMFTILSVFSVQASAKKTRRPGLSISFRKKLIISFGVKHLYFLLIAPSLSLDVFNIDLWTTQNGPWLQALFYSTHGLINTELFYFSDIRVRRSKTRMHKSQF
jgi:hypothetical protein